jgi:hypothetical protein
MRLAGIWIVCSEHTRDPYLTFSSWFEHHAVSRAIPANLLRALSKTLSKTTRPEHKDLLALTGVAGGDQKENGVFVKSCG